MEGWSGMERERGMGKQGVGWKDRGLGDREWEKRCFKSDDRYGKSVREKEGERERKIDRGRTERERGRERERLLVEVRIEKDD